MSTSDELAPAATPPWSGATRLAKWAGPSFPRTHAGRGEQNGPRPGRSSVACLYKIPPRESKGFSMFTRATGPGLKIDAKRADRVSDGEKQSKLLRQRISWHPFRARLWPLHARLSPPPAGTPFLTENVHCGGSFDCRMRRVASRAPALWPDPCHRGVRDRGAAYVYDRCHVNVNYG